MKARTVEEQCVRWARLLAPTWHWRDSGTTVWWCYVDSFRDLDHQTGDCSC